MSKKVVSVALDEELVMEVDELCRETMRKRSWVISQALRNYSDDLEDAEIAMRRQADPNDPTISAREMNDLLGI